MKKTTGEKFFYVFNIIFMLILASSVLFPILNTVSVSLSDREAIYSRAVSFYPIGWEFGAYRQVVTNSLFLRALMNNLGITLVGTFLAVFVTLLVAYSLTKEFFGKKFFTYYFVVSMYFSGGLIPSYIIISNYLKMRNTYWVLFLPALVNCFYVIVMRSQIDTMPTDVFEASYIDGASEYQTLFRVVLPMISPTIAAIAMFFALIFWNQWFNVMVYTDYNRFWSLQYFLRVVVFEKFFSQYSNVLTSAIELREVIPEENFRAAAVVMVALPIVAIYPFVQKYFVKGILSGAVKG